MSLPVVWNLRLLYRNSADPRIEADLTRIERRFAAFADHYRGRPFARSAAALLSALKDYEILLKVAGGGKPALYFALRSDLDAEDKEAQARSVQFEQRLTEAANRVKFFTLTLAKIPPARQQILLRRRDLAPYRYFLEQIFEGARFDLPEGEEQLADLLSQPAYALWVESQERLMSRQIVKDGGREIPLARVLNELPGLPRGRRRTLHRRINEVFKNTSFLAERELNAVFNFKKIMDRRRGFKNPYAATLLANQNREAEIENLIALVSRHFALGHRFYRLQARLLGEKRITLADRAVNIGSIKTKYTFPVAAEILSEALGRFDGECRAIFERLLAAGQYDVYPRAGKKGGAYCLGVAGIPTFVLLNHTDDLRSLETLAHETGHALHSEFSRRQPPLYVHYSTAVAEVASTFFERLVLDEVEKRLSEREQAVLLHNRLLGEMATVFRQTACFNFERDLHQAIRGEGEVSKERIAALLAEHLSSYLGPAVRVTEDDGYFFVHWIHLRQFFYVYTYVYGHLISRALYRRWREDPGYARKIKEFLGAGGSARPAEIFHRIGVDVSRPEFFAEGLEAIADDIRRLERLTGDGGNWFPKRR